MKFTLPPSLFILFASAIILFAGCKSDQIENGEEKENLAFTIREEFLQEFEKTMDPNTNTVPRERLLNAQQVTKQFFIGDRAITGISWQEKGPSNVGGRTRGLIFDKNDVTNNTIFAGGVAGGIWKCTNLSTTATWTKISDVLDNIAVSCIVQNPTTPSIMYFGTGEIWGNLDAMRGLGIWKSIDGGATWNHLSSTTNSQFNYIQNIVITANGVFAATGTGVKKSADGGNSWTTVLVNSISDIQAAANDDIYASNFLGNVFKSTSAQQGNPGTWVNMALPGSHQRLKLATAPSDANKLYVICQQVGGNNVDNIYRSDNGGTNWIAGTVPTIIDQGSNSNFTRGQAWYDLAAVVDPNAPNTVIIGGVDGLRSTDGGLTWNQITTWSLFAAPLFSVTVHADQHIILFSPGSSTTAIWGTDGGIYYTTDVNNVATKPNFVNKNSGYNITQFYAGDINPTAGSNYFLAGAQDNGSQKFAGAAGIQATSSASGGDGAFCHIDQANSLNQVTSYVYSNYYLSVNGGTSFPQKITDNAHGSFINPTDYDDVSKVLFSDYTLVSSGAGGSYGRWLTTGTTNTGVSVANFGGASVSHVCVSPNTANRVYFGLANGSVVYVDGANVATSPAAGTVIKTGTGSVSGIAIETGNENHILVTYSNYGVVSVWETLNGGTNWTSVEGNLPDMPVRWIIFNPNNNDQAMIATELGVWSTDDLNGASTLWTPTNEGLANTRVDMLKVRTADNTIVAATHGRGLFTTVLTNTVLPTVYFEKPNTSVAENGGTVDACTLGTTNVPVNLYLSSAAAADVTVQVIPMASSTTTSGNDYTIATNSVTFPAGTTGPQTVNVSIKDDNSFEGNEYLNLSFSITAGGAFAKPGTTFQSQEIEILDDEKQAISNYSNVTNSGSYNTNLGASSPLQGTQTDKKIQYLYRASELLANGLVKGVIDKISFTVNSKASTAPYNGFTFQMGTTGSTDLSTGFVTLNSPVIINSSNYSATFGVNEFTVPGGFTWDGMSNLVFQFCYDNSAVNSDDVLVGEGPGFTCQAKKATAVGTDAGCTFTATNISTFRPVFTFTQTVPQTTVETALNSSKQATLTDGNTVYYFDAAGNILAKIVNLSPFNYGCTQVIIDRAGTGATAFASNANSNKLMDKTYRVLPGTNNPTGSYQITLYYTAAEKLGWEAATGNSFSNIQMVKVANQIKDVTPGNPTGGGTVSLVTPTIGTIGNDYTLRATFSNGFSGFGAGIPSGPLPVTLIDFKGSLQNAASLLQWSTSSEFNSKNYDVEKSIDGINFFKIGSVNAGRYSVVVSNYAFTDTKLSPLNYYRLRINDMDGRNSLSNVILIKYNESRQNVWVLNNPFISQINLRLAQLPQQKVIIDIFDAKGSKVYSKAYNSNTEININGLSQFSSGAYLLRANVDGVPYTYKIVKQ